MRYLRKINPYVFEELLLLALERQGLTVVRNASYSGDGGTDGQVIIDDECWLIQPNATAGRLHLPIFVTLTSFLNSAPAAVFSFTPGGPDT